MELKKIHWIGIGTSLAIIIISLILIKTKFFFFILGIGILTGASPFVFSIIYETKVDSEKEEMFIEFSRNLVESVNAGTPINKAIINARNKSYGVLTNNIRKLANQISIGIPLNKALQIFANDIKNKMVSRAITLIGQAERSGGEIGKILESVTESVSMIDKLKKERVAAISALVAQGYIIFMVFIVIILVLQFQILPSLIGFSSTGETGSIAIAGLGSTGAKIDSESIANSFVYLLLVQGFFTGLTIGKLSEGRIKSGIKHSFILVIMAFLISTGANILFG